jgi:hypothetical protein
VCAYGAIDPDQPREFMQETKTCRQRTTLRADGHARCATSHARRLPRAKRVGHSRSRKGKGDSFSVCRFGDRCDASCARGHALVNPTLADRYPHQPRGQFRPCQTDKQRHQHQSRASGNIHTRRKQLLPPIHFVLSHKNVPVTRDLLEIFLWKVLSIERCIFSNRVNQFVDEALVPSRHFSIAPVAVGRERTPHGHEC